MLDHKEMEARLHSFLGRFFIAFASIELNLSLRVGGDDSMREIRNRFAHGRWGYIPGLQQVAHVPGYPPGFQDEYRFSLSELDRIVRDADLLNLELSRLAI